MREHKFRAWVGTGWAEDGNTSIDFKMTPPFTIFDIEERGVLLFDKPGLEYVDLQLQGHTLMQYTGLRDKSGKEICEGDVLKALNSHLFEIVWYDGLACFDARSIGCHDEMMNVGWPLSEVIGNIYENPELLEGH